MTLTWKVRSLSCKPSFDGKTNIVETIHWDLTGVDGEYTTSVYGATGINYEEGSSFVDYNSLTEETVITWLKDKLGENDIASYEASVNSQLEALKNPKVVSPPLPF
jgi:hypothetical protein